MESDGAATPPRRARRKWPVDQSGRVLGTKRVISGPHYCGVRGFFFFSLPALDFGCMPTALAAQSTPGQYLVGSC